MTVSRTAYVGFHAFSGPPAQGIAVIADAGDAAAAPAEKTVPNPFWLEPTPSGRTLLVASNCPDGAVSAFAVGDDGTLEERNRVGSGGTGAVHVTAIEGHAVVCNHDSGTVVLLTLDDDESLGDVVDVVTHEGSGPDPENQAGPHPHMALPDPTGTRVVVPDKGTDTVHVYRVDAGAGTLSEVSRLALEPGTGPRHAVFAPDGTALWVVGEQGSTVVRVGYDPATGTLGPAGPAVSTLPTDFVGWNAPSGIVLGPDARHLFVANRGHESIAIIDTTADGPGALRCQKVGAEEGVHSLPWYLGLDGSTLWVANLMAGTVARWTIADDGGLTLEATIEAGGPAAALALV